jgi:hypothetical protein
MKRFIRLKLRPVAAGAILVVAAGCGRDTVKVYHVEASDDATQMPPPVVAPATPIVPNATPAMPATMPAGLPAPDNSSLPPLKYVLPGGWQDKPASQMRVASFGIAEDGKTADVSVVPLGGMAGGDFANVNQKLSPFSRRSSSRSRCWRSPSCSCSSARSRRWTRGFTTRRRVTSANGSSSGSMCSGKNPAPSARRLSHRHDAGAQFRRRAHPIVFNSR